MKLPNVVFFALFATLVVGCLASPVLAQDLPLETSTPAPAPATLWEFLNSPLGISLVGSLLAFVLGKVFTAKPQWKKYAVKYRPLLIQAVKYAEKTIPDGSNPNIGAARLNKALQYVLEINGKLKTPPLVEALTEVHAEAEAAGNV